MSHLSPYLPVKSSFEIHRFTYVDGTIAELKSYNYSDTIRRACNQSEHHEGVTSINGWRWNYRRVSSGWRYVSQDATWRLCTGNS